MIEEDKVVLRKIVESSIKEKFPVTFEKLVTPELSKKKGCFVTLNLNGNLRGCIGNLQASLPLYVSVAENAVMAAYSDYRFEPVSVDEILNLDYEISILTEPVKIKYSDINSLLDQLVVGESGIVIKKGGKSATFLPQVWSQLKTKDSFLSFLCEKAGLDKSEWKNLTLDVLLYTVDVVLGRF